MKLQIKTLITLIILGTLPLQATELEFSLEKKQKAIRTFSGDIDQKSSIHCIIYKDRNTQGYGIKPFFINQQDSIVSLKNIDFFTEPKIKSFHKNGTTLTIITYELEITGQYSKKISILDIDLETQKIKRKEIKGLKNDINIIKLNNKSILLKTQYGKKSNITSTSIKNTSDIIKISHNIPEDNKKQIKLFSISPGNFVNNNVYNKSGPIGNTKIYYENDLLFLENINNLDNYTISSLVLNTAKETPIQYKEHKSIESKKINNMNSFYYQGNLYYIIKTKEEIILTIINHNTGNIIYKASLQYDLAEYINPNDLQAIAKKLKKIIYKPTITVNKSIENQNIVQISYVDTRIYTYDNSMWFHQQMMMQNQQMMTPTIKFGPQMSVDYYYNNQTTTLKEKPPFIKLVFDNELNLVKNASTETIKPFIDKEKNFKIIKDIPGRKYQSKAFTSKTMRVIFYYKKNKKFILKTYKII